jgi:hypothetical protein
MVGMLALTHDALDRDPRATREQKEQVGRLIEEAVHEIQLESPSTDKVVGYLTLLGTLVQAIPNVQPAFDVLRGTARLLGLPV